MDKQTESRRQFEAAWEEVHGVPAVPWESLRKDNFEYKTLHLTAAWRWWRRSRESLVVELPGKISEFNRMAHNGVVTLEAVNYDEAIDDCADALRAIGIRIKGEGDGASS